MAMLERYALICLCCLACPPAAIADDVAAGLWELSLTASVTADPGFAPGPVVINQCVTNADARNPARVLAPIASSGAGDCHYTQTSYTGGTFRFQMLCTGPLHLQTSGEVSFSSTSLSGSMTTSSTIDGNQVELKSALSGRRLGDC